MESSESVHTGWSGGSTSPMNPFDAQYGEPGPEYCCVVGRNVSYHPSVSRPRSSGTPCCTKCRAIPEHSRRVCPGDRGVASSSAPIQYGVAAAIR